jgi:hypothetical protein
MSAFDPIRGNQNFGVVNSVVAGNIADGVNSSVNISNNILGESNNLSSKAEMMFGDIPLWAIRKLEGYTPNNLNLVDSVAGNGGIPFYSSPNQDQIIGTTVPTSQFQDGLPTTADTRLMKLKFDPNNPARNNVIFLRATLEALGPDGEVGPLTTPSTATAAIETSAAICNISGNSQFDFPTNAIAPVDIGDNTNIPQLNTPGGITLMGGNFTNNNGLNFPATEGVDAPTAAQYAFGQGANIVDMAGTAHVGINANQEICFGVNIEGRTTDVRGRSGTSHIKLTLYYCTWEDIYTNF